MTARVINDCAYHQADTTGIISGRAAPLAGDASLALRSSDEGRDRVAQEAASES